MTCAPDTPVSRPCERIPLSVDERDALQGHITDVAGICAWVAFEAGRFPPPPVSFDAGVLLQVDLDSWEPKDTVIELTLSKTGRETFGWLNARLADTQESHPERTALVARACERARGGGVG